MLGGIRDAAIESHDRYDNRKCFDLTLFLGRGGGREGGELLYAGTREDIVNEPRSLTGRALKRWSAAAKS